MMSNMDKAAALMGVVTDKGRPAKERLAAIDELAALKAKMKVGWAKIGVDQAELVAITEALHADGFEASEEELAKQKPRQELDPLEEEPEPAERPAKARLAKAEPEVRGKISQRIRELLKEGDAPYADIQATVLGEFPGHARTTTRSIASVASEMRGKGEDVPIRRKPAKAK